MPDRSVLLYDADCGLCKWITSGLLRWDRSHRLVPCAIQSERGQTLLGDLSPERQLASMHLIAPDGARVSAGAAMAPLLRLLPGGAVPAAGMARAPQLTGWGYDWVATHRIQLSKFIPDAAKRRASERVAQVEHGR